MDANTPCAIGEPVMQKPASLISVHPTPAQEQILRRAAKLSNTSLAAFILDAAYQAAQQATLEQPGLVLQGPQAQEYSALLDRPASDSAGLKDLLSRPTPW